MVVTGQREPGVRRDVIGVFYVLSKDNWLMILSDWSVFMPNQLLIIFNIIMVLSLMVLFAFVTYIHDLI